MTAQFSSRNFRSDDGIWEWQRLMAAREGEPEVFFAVFSDRPAPNETLLRALGGIRIDVLGGASIPPVTPERLFYSK